MVRRLSGSRPHGALSLDGDGMQGMPAAGLIGLPVVSPCLGAGMSQPLADWVRSRVPFQVGCPLVAQAVSRDSVLVLRPEVTCQPTDFDGEVDRAVNANEQFPPPR